MESYIGPNVYLFLQEYDPIWCDIPRYKYKKMYGVAISTL